jgi:broad specificity phosphatase PhoE/predicted nucleotidyltransferase
MLKITKSLRNKVLKKSVLQLKNLEDLLSITFVGSFIDKDNLKSVSDLDLIIITKKLNKKIFEKYIKLIKKINLKNVLKKNNLIINSTFGPLKFNKNKNDLVVHLMIYDLKGHIDHCLKSPFTVYDWERSSFFYKNNLQNLYPVGTLQIRDFVEARRGIKSYLNDIIKKKISYREYSFKRNKYDTNIKNLNLSDRDKLEFYFHISKNLILNFIKFINQKNKLYLLKKNDKKIYKFFGKNFYLKHIREINQLIHKKENSDFKLNDQFDKWIIKFVNDYQKKLNLVLKNSKKIVFFRHAKTSLNDGSFLGQYRNPGIIKQNKLSKKYSFSKIFISPLKRCEETAKVLCKSKKYIKDKNLLEINYGQAEGMKLENFIIKYPQINEKWLNKKDPKFPSGESFKEVNFRVNKFIKRLIHLNQDNVCVITHNNFLRILIGQSFNIPKEKWYKIYISHLMKLEFVLYEKKFYPNINRKDLKKIFSKL